jgi:predicted ATP-grasp superfamily ATP-dependent carboligase
MYTGALENHPDLVDAMAEVVPLWGNGGKVLLRVRSPLRLSATLQQANFLFPETRESPVGLPRDGSWLAKTGRGASGSGVRILISSGDPSIRASGRHFFQRRVAGTPYSAVFVAADGGATLLGVVQQLVGEPWLGARQFQYCGAIGPANLPTSVHVEISRIGHVLAREFGLIGLFGVDLVIDKEQVWTIEVNPRYTASAEIIERTEEVCSIKSHADAITNHAKSPGIPQPASAFKHQAKAILFARQPTTITPRIHRALITEASQTSWPALADIPHPHTSIEKHHPVLTIFAELAHNGEPIKFLQNRVAILERTLYS